MKSIAIERYLTRSTNGFGSRKRNHSEFHVNYADTQITHIEILKGSYFQPHSHLLDKRDEYLVMLSGLVRLFIFTVEGQVERSTLLGDEVLGVFIPYNIVHTLAVESSKASLVDIKNGPYVKETAKFFPEWSISENSDNVLLEREIDRWQNEASSLR